MSRVALGDVLIEQKVVVGTIDGNGLPLIGVDNKIGLHLSRHKRLSDLSRYKLLKSYWFAYNPMRINIGSIGYANVESKTGIISPDYIVFSCSDLILPEYFFHFIKSDIGLREISKNTGGSVRERLYFRNLSKIEIELPSIEEQKKIVRSLNRQKALLTILNEECLLLKVDIQLLRQTILQEAVQGRLTKQDESDEPASELLKRIKAEKQALVKEGKLKKEKELPPITEDEIPFELPKGWVWCRLKDIGFITGGGTPSTSNSNYWNGNIPWITPKDMKEDFLSDAQDKVTLEGVNNSSAKLIPPNSVLVVGRSGILKRTLPVCINTVECVVNQDLKVIVPHLKGMAKYVQLMLQGHEEFILKKLIKYGMTVHSLMYQEFETQVFPLPPLAEQQRIVTKVQQLQQHLTALENQIQQSQQTAEQLLQTVLKEAFAGKAKQYEMNEELSLAAEN